jgi:hypothetical protein
MVLRSELAVVGYGYSDVVGVADDVSGNGETVSFSKSVVQEFVLEAIDDGAVRF